MRLGLDGSGSRAAGFVLAGGESSRMGTDKALVPLAGQPLIVHALGLLREAGLEPAIAGARSDLSDYGRVIADGGIGPLGGICAALTMASSDFSVFVSVDAPLLGAGLLTFLLEHAQRTDAGIVLASVNGFAQTFPCAIQRSLLPALQAELDGGNDGCFAAFREAAASTRKPLRILAVEELAQTGQVEHPMGFPVTSWFLNVNTPADLVRSEALLALHYRVS